MVCMYMVKERILLGYSINKNKRGEASTPLTRCISKEF